MATLGSAAVLTACLFDGQTAKRGTVVDNEIRVGILRLADGSPAVNARVRIYPVHHRPDGSSGSGAVFSGRTDTRGEYIFTSMPKGEYNVVGELDGKYSYQDSLFLTPATNSISTGTLDEPGSMAGIVGMQPNHNPASALVQVLGTDTYANVGEDGRFRLSNLAGGDYSIRVITTEAQYTPLIARIKIRTGRNDSLVDTLKLIYTGIPVVTGLNATYDTARAMVRLTWKPVAYLNFSEYQVFRDTVGAKELTKVPVGLVTDTQFQESLLKSPSGIGIFTPTDSVDAQLEYRVRVKNKSDQTGLVYGNLKVVAAAPGCVRTIMQMQVAKVAWDPVQLADSFTVVAKFRNPTRGQASIIWTMGDSNSTVATHKLGGKAFESDTLRFEWSKEGPFTLHARVTDDAGSQWLDSLKVAGNTPPRISGVPPALVEGYDQYRFQPAVLDAEGDKLRFSVVNLPAWATFDTVTGTMAGAPGNPQAGNYPGIVIRVSDGRRIASLASFAVHVKAIPWIPKRPVPESSDYPLAVPLNGKVYLMEGEGGGGKMFIYDIASDAWSPGTPMPAKLQALNVFSGAHAVNGKIYLMGGLDPNGAATRNVWEFDPGSGTWGSRSPMIQTRLEFTSVVFHDRILVLGGLDSSEKVVNTVDEFDPKTNTWSRKVPAAIFPGGAPGPPKGAKGTVLGEKIYTTGWNIGSIVFSTLLIYDPQTNGWTEGAHMEGTAGLRGSVCGASGRLYVAGGTEIPSWEPVRTLMYDPSSDAWTPKRFPPVHRYSMACAETGTKIFFFQGTDPQNGQQRTNSVYEYDPQFED